MAIDFEGDLKKGGRGEEMILRIIQRKYPEAFIADEYNYDIYIPEINKTVEVKTDLGSYRTQNTVFENTWKGKETGINKEYDYWAQIFYFKGWKYFITDPTTIKGLVWNASEVPAGDMKSSTIYLVRKEDILNNALIQVKKLKT